MLGTVFIAGDHATGRAAVVDRLSLCIGLAGVAVQALDEAATNRTLLTQPDRRADDENIRAKDLLMQLRPVVLLEAMFTHIRVDAGRQRQIDGSQHVGTDAVAAHHVLGYAHQAFGV